MKIKTVDAVHMYGHKGWLRRQTVKVTHITLENRDWQDYPERLFSEIIEDLYAVCGVGYIDRVLVDQWWLFVWECDHSEDGGPRIQISAKSHGVLDLHNAATNCLVNYRRVHDDIVTGAIDPEAANVQI